MCEGVKLIFSNDFCGISKKIMSRRVSLFFLDESGLDLWAISERRLDIQRAQKCFLLFAVPTPLVNLCAAKIQEAGKGRDLFPAPVGVQLERVLELSDLFSCETEPLVRVQRDTMALV